jgi:Uma2 family endonuclease
MPPTPVRTRRWTRLEYDRMIELGAFRPGERLELIGGGLVVREPQGRLHSTAIELADAALRNAFGAGWRVRVQLPVALDHESEPEPDLSVVRGHPRDASGHPAHPALLVEVAESSIAFDREHKGSLYARARVREYWIVNLVDGVLEVYRDPTLSPGAPYGCAYAMCLRLGAGETASPLAAPHARIAVADLLP